MRSATYVCPNCRATVDRPFRTPSVMRSCENACEFGHHLREDLLASIDGVPEADRPDDWSELSIRDRLFVAMRAGAVSPADL
jgi:hypothetical protein